MKAAIKTLLDELIYSEQHRKPLSLLKKAYEHQEERTIYSLIGWLLVWHKQVFLGLQKAGAYPISKVLYEKFSILFENCTELKQAFSLHKDHLGFAEDLSEQEQEEIRDYIHEHYQVEKRVRRNMK